VTIVIPAPLLLHYLFLMGRGERPWKVKNATFLTILKQRFDADHISTIKRMTQK